MKKEVLKTAVLNAIKHRRSTRTFLQDPVSEGIINEILEAGRYSPSANNTQATHFYVITSPEKRAELKAAVAAALAGVTEKEGMSQSFRNLLKRAKEVDVDVTYGAPVLIVTTNKKGSPNAIADCSCTLQNMMLAASVNEIANVWINQFFTLRDTPPVAEFFASIGVSEEEEICGSLALGYSEKVEKEPLPRTGFPITYIR